jgi:hypothetical protein
VLVAALTLALGGGWLALPLLGCVAVMSMMIWMMFTGTGPGRRHG